MSKEYLVWDLPLRIFHWSIATTFFALWYTSDQDTGLIEIHIKLGFVALGLVLFRVAWGVIGTKHALFKNFIPTLIQLKQYLKRDNTKPTFAGHNPAGSLMVVLMLVLILVQAISGLFINDDVFSSGPYYGSISDSAGSLMNTIHHKGFDIILISVTIHILAVLYYWKVKKKNLVKPMITGKKSSKDASSHDSIKHSKLVIALVTITSIGLFIYWLVVLNAPVVEELYY
jgi:cytochrome b